MMRSHGSRSRREKGAAAVEFAIIFPLMFLVIAGIVDFGRAFFTQIQLTNAAREGARAAIVMSGTAGDPRPSISARASAAAGAVPNVTVYPTATCNGSTGTATVIVQAPFQWILIQPAMNIIGAGWGAGGTLSSTGVMQCGG